MQTGFVPLLTQSLHTMSHGVWGGDTLGANTKVQMHVWCALMYSALPAYPKCTVTGPLNEVQTSQCKGHSCRHARRCTSVFPRLHPRRTTATACMLFWYCIRTKQQNATKSRKCNKYIKEMTRQVQKQVELCKTGKERWQCHGKTFAMPYLNCSD